MKDRYRLVRRGRHYSYRKVTSEFLGTFGLVVSGTGAHFQPTDFHSRQWRANLETNLAGFPESKLLPSTAHFFRSP